MTLKEPAAATWIEPKPVKVPPAGLDWAHEIKFDGYRIHARIDGGRARHDVVILGRTGDAPAPASLERDCQTS
jgi:bifunctional non-homologous end joining protein LigD